MFKGLGSEWHGNAQPISDLLSQSTIAIMQGLVKHFALIGSVPVDVQRAQQDHAWRRSIEYGCH